MVKVNQQNGKSEFIKETELKVLNFTNVSYE